MPIYRVALRRPIFKEGVNPFYKHIDITAKVEVNERVWEFEAKDKDDVRRLYAQAQKQRIANVHGYNLHSIEEVPQHVCGLQGFGQVGDRCEACERYRTSSPRAEHLK